MAGSFMLDLAKFEKKVAGSGGTMQACITKIALEIFKRVIEKSPVDTGRFRANWSVMIGKYGIGTTESLDPTPRMNRTGPTIAQAEWDTLKWNGQGNIFLTNNLVYSIPLEYGHSKKQAPAGMVRVTIAEVQAGIDQIVQGIANGSS